MGGGSLWNARDFVCLSKKWFEMCRVEMVLCSKMTVFVFGNDRFHWFCVPK